MFSANTALFLTHKCLYYLFSLLWDSFALPSPSEFLLIFEDLVQMPLPRKSQTHPQPGLIFVYALYLPCSLSRAGCYCIALSLLDDTFFFIHYWVGFVLKYCLFNVFIAHLLGTGPYTQFKKLCLSIKSENLGVLSHWNVSVICYSSITWHILIDTILF